jgi:hypothetical protein
MVVISDSISIPLSTVKEITVEYEKHELPEDQIRRVKK